MTVFNFSVFLKLKICAVFGSDKLSERGWIGSLARRVDGIDEKAIVCFAVQRNHVLTSMAVPSMFKHNYDIPEKKPQKSKAAENLHRK